MGTNSSDAAADDVAEEPALLSDFTPDARLEGVLLPAGTIRLHVLARVRACVRECARAV
jgi:hypothetical protein